MSGNKKSHAILFIPKRTRLGIKIRIIKYMTYIALCQKMTEQYLLKMVFCARYKMLASVMNGLGKEYNSARNGKKTVYLWIFLKSF